MNDFARRVIMDRLAKSDRKPYRDRRRRADRKDYDDDERRDMYNDSRRDMRDVEDSRKDMRDKHYPEEHEDFGDYHHQVPQMRLRKQDILEWKRDMENTDGTYGERYKIDEVMSTAKKLGVKFDGFNEKELCLLTNVVYSDIGHLLKRYISKEDELIFCVDVAQAIFDDPDGPEGFEKLALYYYCIVCYGQL